MAREILAFYEEHGFAKTARRYHTNALALRKTLPSLLEEPVKHKANGAGRAGPSRQTYLLARKLKDAVTERLRSGVELGDVEIYATLLTRQLLE